MGNEFVINREIKEIKQGPIKEFNMVFMEELNRHNRWILKLVNRLNELNEN